MSIWRHLADSYTRNREMLKTTYPLSSTTISNMSDHIIVISVDEHGRFLKAETIPKVSRAEGGVQRIPIPVSEDSMSRTSGAWKNPHPLFEQYGFFKKNDKRFTGSGEVKGYLKQLQEFAHASDHPKIKAIAAYVGRKRLEDDVKGLPSSDKTMVLFKVHVPDDPLTEVWRDPTIFEAWHQYYTQGRKTGLDAVTGEAQNIAIAHPKKISNTVANAKLISANDTTNFTFRGRFDSANESLSMGYESSQKAHQFLTFLVENRGMVCKEQVILSFSVGSVEQDAPPPLGEEQSIWELIQSAPAAALADAHALLQAETGYDYAQALQAAMQGRAYRNALEKHPDTIVLALDAATTGSMAITFYRHLSRQDYLEKLREWHQDCKWIHRFLNRETGRQVVYAGAPFTSRIVEAVHGKPRGGKDESFIKLKKSANERLLRCIFDGAPLPYDFVRAAIHRASKPMAFSSGGKFNRFAHDELLSTTCALIRKDHKQRTQEEIPLSLDPKRNDRDYLYGRLLGAADKLEEYALHKGQKDRTATAAIRYMQPFAQRPFTTWLTIHNCLRPYIQKVGDSLARQEIQAAHTLFLPGDYENDAPLSGAYLLGYYVQREHIDRTAREISKSKKEKQMEIEHE